MSTIKKIIWIAAILLWLLSLVLLTIALTDLIPNNPLKEYRLIIGIGFITISGFIRNALKKLAKQEPSH
ncbi:MAG TPA: hypothetical protein VGK10_00220 [Prolixibacteraceae bacterium]|jgi:hypothetical protein